jgi:hypothetical protein
MTLYFFVAHLDDFEISCLGFLLRNHSLYNNIEIITASTWAPKVSIWERNLSLIEEMCGRKIKYTNLGFDQRSLTTNFDLVKDKIYKSIDFKQGVFDLVTHDSEDCHTDHTSLHYISKGLYKYCNKFITFYSPSSLNFVPNYWLGLESEEFNIKKKMLNFYDINVEQSYSKLGYYLQSESHYDFGTRYFHENFTKGKYKHYECYRILKWI